MYKVCETVRATHGKDGAVVLDVQRGRVLRLNVTGSVIFECVQQGQQESQIIDLIAQRFSVSHEVAQVDAYEFLESLQKEGIVCPATSMVQQ